nr:cytochrome c oxidase subunit 3 [Antarctophthirus carlinii]
MFKFGFHPFHIVSPSPWPLLTSLSLFSLMSSSFSLLTNGKLPILELSCLLLSVFQWWRDVVNESLLLGKQTKPVLISLKVSMLLFIASEAALFFSLFYTWLFMSLSPDPSLGLSFPPVGVAPMQISQVPLTNTILLLSSSVAITMSHNSISNPNQLTTALNELLYTIILGLTFLLLQMKEYYDVSFTMSDGVYGSMFFVTTGLHGSHVLVGLIFLTICLIRMLLKHFTVQSHFGFLAAIWYWHFVDVVWLVVFTVIYWWPL